MFKKFASMILILLMTASIFVGCKTEEASKPVDSKTSSGKKVDGGTMVFRVNSDSKVVNPLYGNDRTTLTLINNIFSSLYNMEGEKIEYNLAENVDVSDDYLSYTVKLKKDLKWHDGKAITANDLVFTFNTIMDKKQGSHLRNKFMAASGEVKIEKVDDLTVKFILPEIQVAFLDKIGGIRMIPEHVYKGIENIEVSEVNNNPIGSGPFKFESKKAGESITLARFDGYFNGKPNLEKVVYRIIPDDAAAEIALKNGEVDAKYITAKDVENTEKDGLNIIKFDENRVGYIILNQNNKILQNEKLRHAIAYALNREELIKARFMSTEYAEPAKTFLAKDALYKTDEVEEYKQDIEKSKQLIKESGLKDIKLTMVYIGSDNALELMVQQSLKEVGIEVELKSMEQSAFINVLFNPESRNEYDLAYNGYIYGKEPSLYAQVFKAGSENNVNNYNNPEVEKLFDKADKETDKNKRAELYKKIQQMVISDMPMYPVDYKYAIVAVNPKFKGLEEAKPAAIYMFEDLSKVYITE